MAKQSCSVKDCDGEAVGQTPQGKWLCRTHWLEHLRDKGRRLAEKARGKVKDEPAQDAEM